MHPVIFGEFRRITATLGITGRVLEVGALPSNGSLLTMAELAGCERVGINIGPPSAFNGIAILQMNGNDMRGFESEQFDAVLSNATLEHDPRFWLTCAEIRRVLKPGGVAVIGVPGFLPDADLDRLGLAIPGGAPDQDYKNASLTFKYHGAPHDYYRFSEMAIGEVFFQGYRDVQIRPVMRPPRLIGQGRKN